MWDDRELTELVERQLDAFFGTSPVAPYIEASRSRAMRCFAASRNGYYRGPHDQITFSPLHSGQYSIFLYYLANTIHKTSGDSELAAKVYYLNKIMNSVDWFYAIELPPVFDVEHPVGSVLGRAQYSDRLFLYQGCTVGGNKGHYPTLGSGVILHANATILGRSRIGDNVAISVGTQIVDEDIPDNSLVFGRSPNLTVKAKDASYMLEFVGRHFI